MLRDKPDSNAATNRFQPTSLGNESKIKSGLTCRALAKVCGAAAATGITAAGAVAATAGLGVCGGTDTIIVGGVEEEAGEEDACTDTAAITTPLWCGGGAEEAPTEETEAGS